MSNHRVGRVRQEVLREVNDILRSDVKDPRVIYYSTLSDKAGERQKTQAGLDSVQGLIRSKLGERLTLYKVPSIRFERDQSIDYGQRIDQLLDQIHQTDEE